MRFEAVLAQWENHAMSQAEAVHVLGVTERTFRRWCQRYGEDGPEGLLDRRIGKPSPKRVPPEWVARVAELYIERYQDFNAKHFHEHQVGEHNFPWSYSWTKTLLHQRQLLAVAPSTGGASQEAPAAARRRGAGGRPSKDLPGFAGIAILSGDSAGGMPLVPRRFSMAAE